MARRPDFLGTWMNKDDGWLVRVDPRSRRASPPRVGAIISLRVRRKDGASQQRRVRIVEQHKRYSLAEPLDETGTGDDSQQQSHAPDVNERAGRLQEIDLSQSLVGSEMAYASTTPTNEGSESL